MTDVQMESVARYYLLLTRQGQLDNYLKALHEGIIARKAELDSGGKQPKQLHIDPWVADVAAAAPSVVPPPAASPPPRSLRRNYTRSRKPFNRLDVTLPAFDGKVRTVPEPPSPDNDHIMLRSAYYSKADIMGKVIQIGYHFSVEDVRAKVVGIGPKAVKVLLVNAPPAGAGMSSGRRHVDVYKAWEDNEPIYISHASLFSILGTE